MYTYEINLFIVTNDKDNYNHLKCADFYFEIK